MGSIGRIAEIWRYPVKSMGGEQLRSCELGAFGLPGDRGWALRDEVAGEIRGAKKLPGLMLCRAVYTQEPAVGRVPPAEITLPDGTRFASDSPEANARLSEFLGRRVTLWPLQPPENTDHYRHAPIDPENLEQELRSVFGRLEDEPLPDLSMIPPELFEFTSPLGTYFDAFPVHLLTTASLRHLASKNGRSAFDRRRFRPNFLIETNEDVAGLVEAGWSGRILRIGSAALHVQMPTVRCVMTTQATADLPKDPGVLRTIVADADQNLGAYATVTRAGAISVGDDVVLE